MKQATIRNARNKTKNTFTTEMLLRYSSILSRPDVVNADIYLQAKHLFAFALEQLKKPKNIISKITNTQKEKIGAQELHIKQSLFKF